jgi:hypothetical protein
MNKLALAAGGAHFPEVFKQNQEQYTKQVLLECYKLFQDSELPGEYLALDFLLDIQKHFDIKLTN